MLDDTVYRKSAENDRDCEGGILAFSAMIPRILDTYLNASSTCLMRRIDLSTLMPPKLIRLMSASVLCRLAQSRDLSNSLAHSILDRPSH